jgi:hypothetical protein
MRKDKVESFFYLITKQEKIEIIKFIIVEFKRKWKNNSDYWLYVVFKSAEWFLKHISHQVLNFIRNLFLKFFVF